MNQCLPILVCPHCERRIPLPYRNLRGTTGVEAYWPPDSDTLTLVCPHCAHLSVHSEQDICTEEVHGVDPNQAPVIFWRVEFACSKFQCEGSVAVHTQTEVSGDINHNTIAGRAYKTTPKLRCPECGGEKMNLERVDRVIMGGEGWYLT